MFFVKTLGDKFLQFFILTNISCGFNFTNWLSVDFSQGFIFVNLSSINIFDILIFLWFFLQLVVWESWNSYPNFSMFQIPLFEYKKLNSGLNS